MAKVALSTVPTGSTLIDENSTFEGEVLKWTVVAHNTDGDGITTLILDPFLAYDLWHNRKYNLVWDAQEPSNPTDGRADYGNPSYEYSNLLQFLNSDGLANEWFIAQHDYDQAPTADYVGDVETGKSKGFADKDAFLAHFSDNFKGDLKTVTKYNVARKVHLPSWREVLPSTADMSSAGDKEKMTTFDDGVRYNTYLSTVNSTYSGFSFFVRGDAGSSYSEYSQTRCPVPYVSITYNSQWSTYKNYVRNGGGAPYAYNLMIAPVIYVDSTMKVAKDGDAYYTAYSTIPTITVKDDFRSHAFAFDVVFQVNDLDRDTITSTVSIDGTQYYSNTNTPRGTKVTATIPSNTFSALSKGTHTITITAKDDTNTVTATSKFYKSDVEMTTLASVSEKIVFVDNNTKHDDEPIEWYLAAKDVEGEGVVTLMMKNPLPNYCYDAKEVNNPTSIFANNGNPSYEYSNLLQWLNSDKEGDEWFEAQHPYDNAPIAGTTGKPYASENGFLYRFNETLIGAMNDVEKMGVTRKVHIPSYKEIVGNSSIKSTEHDAKFDEGEVYTNTFNGYLTLIARSETAASMPALYVRSMPETNNYRIGTLLYLGSSTKDIYLKTLAPDFISSNYPIYTIPIIYVTGEDIPVRYDSTSQKYYLDYGFEVRYDDYGKHKGGFPVEVKINGSTLSGVSTIKAYVDNSTSEVVTIETEKYNEYVVLNIPNMPDLASGEHTIRLEVQTYGIKASTSFAYTKVEETLPTILSNEVGSVTETFDTTYQVYDDDGDSIDVVIKLDNSQIDSKTNVEQKTDLTISVGASRFNSLSYGNHTLSIVATDGTNEVTKDIAFKKCSVPSVSIVNPTIGEVVSPFSVQVNYSNADGGVVTFKAYIDGQEIPQ